MSQREFQRLLADRRIPRTWKLFAKWAGFDRHIGHLTGLKTFR